MTKKEMSRERLRAPTRLEADRPSNTRRRVGLKGWKTDTNLVSGRFNQRNKVPSENWLRRSFVHEKGTLGEHSRPQQQTEVGLR
jgi:hypothetical protein